MLNCSPDATQAELADVVDFVHSFLPDVSIPKAAHVKQFRVPTSSIGLADIFEQLEARPLELRVENYSVAQPSLEQVFMELIRKYSPEEHTEDHSEEDADGNG
jgi:hypothetical protein